MRNRPRMNAADATPRIEAQPGQYEPPAIEERTKIGVPLALVSSLVSAEFRPSVAYEPPAIEERTPIGLPLVGVGSPSSAAFRPSVADEPPTIDRP